VNPNDGIVWHLRIQEQRLGTVGVLRLEGRIYHATAADLASALARFCTSGHTVVLDLSAVDYINGEGLGVLEATAARLRAMDADVIVFGLSPVVRTAFDLSGASERLSIDESQDTAFARIQERKRP
jgi:anti-anti-sigma factor